MGRPSDVKPSGRLAAGPLLRLNGTVNSPMGAALKIDPTKIKIDHIWNTSGCPLAREIRKALRKKNIHKKF